MTTYETPDMILTPGLPSSPARRAPLSQAERAATGIAAVSVAGFAAYGLVRMTSRAAYPRLANRNTAIARHSGSALP
jgi:hypothetical protein